MTIKYTQIFFDEETKIRKEKADITWNDAALLGIHVKEKMNTMNFDNVEEVIGLMKQIKVIP